MEKYIPLSVPKLRGKEKEYIMDAIENEWVSTGGSYIDVFEKNIAEYLGVEGAVACQSGTAGLHLALQLCGVEAGDMVIVPTLTFIAAVNPVRYLGAEPIFMDCDETLTMDTKKLLKFINEECLYQECKLLHKSSGRHIKAIVVVHVFGNTANMGEIMQIANDYNIKVVEDATEALGTYYTEGTYKGKYLGTIGDFGVYSFNGNKIITTGGGGMLVAQDAELLKKAKYLSTQAKDDQLNYVHNEVGYNYRMTNLQAALGVAQLEQLEDFVRIKTENYETYRTLFETAKGISLLEFRKDIRPNYWFYSLVLDESVIGMTCGDMIEKLAQYHIQTRPIWGLIHEQKPYKNSEAYQIEKAIFYKDKIVNIPCSTSLSSEDVEEVAAAIRKIVAT